MKLQLEAEAGRDSRHTHDRFSVLLFVCLILLDVLVTYGMTSDVKP